MNKIIEWENMSNTEIRIKLMSMEDEYENIKNKINEYINKLDELDVEYSNGKKEIEKRSKK
jgi:hypothetical protein